MLHCILTGKTERKTVALKNRTNVNFGRETFLSNTKGNNDEEGGGGGDYFFKPQFTF